MFKTILSLALSPLLFLTPTQRPLEAQQPPVARRSDHVDSYHGVEVADPYRWLEEMDSPDVQSWVLGQDRYARRFAAEFPQRELIRERITRVARTRRFGTPVKRGDRYFHLRFGSGGAGTDSEYMVQQGSTGRPTVLIDARGLGEGGRSRLARPTPSADGHLVAYGVAEASSRWMTLRIRDVDSGHDIADTLIGLNSSTSTITWAQQDDGFFYERFDLPAEGQRLRAQLKNERVYYHRVGDSQAHDRLIYAPQDTDRVLGHWVSHDGRFLIISERDPQSTGNRILYKDLGRADSEVVVLIGSEDAKYAFIGNDETQLWFQTDWEAPRGRVIAINTQSPGRNDWVELIPEAPEPIDSWVGASAVGGHLIVGYLRQARLLVRVFDTGGTHRYDLALPYPGSIWSGFLGRQDDAEVFYNISGLVDPGSIYRLDVRTGESTLFARPELAYDPNEFVTRQVFFTSRDGTRIPMFLVHRRGLTEDGRAPVFMYGYGFGNWAAAPWFQPHMVIWLQMGGIWALPNIRGGGEFGEEWHQAGMRLNKQNAIDDYIAATEHLISAGYTTRELFVANASSAGGPIAAAAIVQRPRLYAAAVLDFPILDLLRYDRFTDALRWQPEYGSSQNPQDFHALAAYSPVHNVEPGICYPATLVAPGEKDETTPPFHAYKFVAALQQAQSCSDPVLLRVSWDTGHTYGASLETSIENWADQLAFLARVLVRHGWAPDLGHPPSTSRQPAE